MNSLTFLKIASGCATWLAFGMVGWPLSSAADEPNAAPRGVILTPMEAREDLEFLMNTFSEVHPNLYFKVPASELTERRAQIASRLDHAVSVREFYDTINPFVRSFADKHTQLYPPSETKPPSEKVSEQPKAWTFQLLAKNIGYLQFNEMPTDRRAEWQAFLQETFQTIHDRHVTSLVIDLRKNGGGDSGLAEDLLNYLTARPYQLVKRKAWRLSERFLKSPGFDNFIKSLAASESYYAGAPTPEQITYLSQNPSIEHKRIIIARYPEWLKAYLKKYAPHWLDLGYSPETASEWLYFDFPLIVPPRAYPLRFSGRTCFIVGKDTFSSAVILANAVQDFHLAELIGEETPPCNQFGEVYYFQLPHSHLGAMAPSAQLVRANGDAQDTHGVLPGIVVVPMPTNSADQTDATLEAAKRWAAAIE